jgi:hypothetical protein
MVDNQYKMKRLLTCPKCRKRMELINDGHFRHQTGGIIYKQRFRCNTESCNILVRERTYMLVDVSTINDPENTPLKAPYKF